MLRARRRADAFTLIELVVTLVILAVLATFAVGTYTRVQDEAKDQVSVTELRAVQRQAWALQVAAQAHGYVQDDFRDVPVTAHAAGAPGVQAAGQLTVSTQTDTAGQPTSTRHGEVAVGCAGTDGTPTDCTSPAPIAGLGMRSLNSKHCVFLRADQGTAQTWVADYDPADGCPSTIALAGHTSTAPATGGTAGNDPGAGPGGSGPGTAGSGTSCASVAAAPVAHPQLPAAWLPAGATGADTIEPCPPDGGGTTGTDPATPLYGSFSAVTSFPSADTDPPHRIYGAMDDGSLVEVLDDGTCGQAGTCGHTTLLPAGTFPARVTGLIAGSRPDTGNTGPLHYNTVYAVSSDGTLTSVAHDASGFHAATLPSTGSSTPIAFGACFTASDTATGDLCLYQADYRGGYGLAVLDLNTGTTSFVAAPGLNGTNNYIAPVPVSYRGQAALAVAADYSGTIQFIAPGSGTVLGEVDDPAGNESMASFDDQLFILSDSSGVDQVQLATGTLTAAGNDGALAAFASIHSHGVPGEFYGPGYNDTCLHKLTAANVDEKLTCPKRLLNLGDVTSPLAATLPGGIHTVLAYDANRSGGSGDGWLRLDEPTGCGYPTANLCPADYLLPAVPASVVDFFTTAQFDGTDKVYAVTSDGQGGLGVAAVNPATGAFSGPTSTVYTSPDGGYTQWAGAVGGPCLNPDGSTQDGQCLYGVINTMDTSTYQTTAGLHRWRVAPDGSVTDAAFGPAGAAGQGSNMFAGLTTYAGHLVASEEYENADGQAVTAFHDLATGTVLGTVNSPLAVGLPDGSMVTVSFGTDGVSLSSGQSFPYYVTSSASGSDLALVNAGGSSVLFDVSGQLWRIDTATGAKTLLANGMKVGIMY